ncbi:MAG: type VI secretion system ATPase TssH [Planctomycetota bacterium]
MVELNLKELVGKLHPLGRRTLEGAAGLCLSRTNYNVELEHWLLKLMEQDASDFNTALKHFGVDQARLAGDLTRVVDSFKTGNSRPPALSPSVVDLLRSAWLVASVDFGQPVARTGHLLIALLSDGQVASQVTSESAEFAKVSHEKLKAEFATILADTEEDTPVSAPGGAPAAAGPTKTPGLDQYTIDLTARAKAGEIDPVLGRDPEIRQLMDILMRRRQNNPILTGEAGVGKTAVVEGFALRVASGDVPPPLENVAIRSLDMGLLQAGAGIKGEFENRLKSVISEVKSSPTPIIVFIDEAHNLIGGGQNDAANLLKPALARGELRTIAATTWAEYKKFFEKDAALTRRFQVVKVEEPAEPVAVEMIRGLVGTLEGHHQVRIASDAVIDAVKLSSRYIAGRQLPDKAVSLIDTTCARIALSQSATPPAVEDCRRRLEQIDVSMRILRREALEGADHGEKLAELEAEHESEAAALAGLEQRWQREKELATSIGECVRKLSPADEDAAPADSPKAEGTDAAANDALATEANGVAPTPLTDEEIAGLQAELAQLESQLAEVQGEEPLVHPRVTPQAVAETVAAWTGIPLGRMVADEVKTVLNLKDRMEESVVGQGHALDRIAQSIRTSRANLADPQRPIGVFLLAGTSGVGKTETAITLAELLYGGEQNMTTINMSEFKEEHKVSLLMGSPPGYVGYGEGGVLTEAVRRKPYSVVLLDEMEKAHAGVQDVFYQVFDKGAMKDGEGRDIDFRNTVIIMTTNAGTDLVKSLCSDPDTTPEPDGFVEALFPELLKTFKPAFLGRLTIIPYYPLADDVLKKIIGLKLGKVGKRVVEHYGAKFDYTPELVDAIAARCTEVDTGARNIDHILTKTLLPELSAEFLSRMAEGEAIEHVGITVGDEGGFEYELR